jgi:hypothetical protein
MKNRQWHSPFSLARDTRVTWREGHTNPGRTRQRTGLPAELQGIKSFVLPAAKHGAASARRADRLPTPQRTRKQPPDLLLTYTSTVQRKSNQRRPKGQTAKQHSGCTGPIPAMRGLAWWAPVQARACEGCRACWRCPATRVAGARARDAAWKKCLRALQRGEGERDHHAAQPPHPTKPLPHTTTQRRSGTLPNAPRFSSTSSFQVGPPFRLPMRPPTALPACAANNCRSSWPGRPAAHGAFIQCLRPQHHAGALPPAGWPTLRSLGAAGHTCMPQALLPPGAARRRRLAAPLSASSSSLSLALRPALSRPARPASAQGSSQPVVASARLPPPLSRRAPAAAVLCASAGPAWQVGEAGCEDAQRDAAEGVGSRDAVGSRQLSREPGDGALSAAWCDTDDLALPPGAAHSGERPPQPSLKMLGSSLRAAPAVSSHPGTRRDSPCQWADRPGTRVEGLRTSRAPVGARAAV